MESKYKVILFYKFTHIAAPKAVIKIHRKKAEELNLLGRMFVAKEGINATFEGKNDDIEAYVNFLHSDSLFSDVIIKESRGNGRGFTRLAIKERKEVVTLNAGEFDIEKETAPKLSADELERWYEDQEDFVVLDLRNDFEIQVGKFDKTIDPGLSNFRDLPQKLDTIKDLKDKKIVAVCTGGIRCEKATCLLKREGFSDIYQLKDGIHTYIQKNPRSHFKGSLFVFDNRMTTDVVDLDSKIVIGRCFFCGNSTEKFCSDDSTRPSKKILCCDNCFIGQPDHIRRSSDVQLN